MTNYHPDPQRAYESHCADAYLVEDDEIARLRDERDILRRGGKTLGEIIDRQCRDVLDATGLHHLIGEDGNGDWGLVWEHLAELGDGKRAAEAEVERLRDTAAALEADNARLTEALRARLDALPDPDGEDGEDIPVKVVGSGMTFYRDGYVEALESFADYVEETISTLSDTTGEATR